ncbi:MAG TPA: aminotransferase class IV [Dokdonella sp.]|nr:aminotransferase class IV [Dokdonella sp.]
MKPAQPTSELIELNGRAPEPRELAFLAQVNYGHFTTMQVRDRGVRGFGLHLQRLAEATRALFGSELDLELVRKHLRRIISDAPASVRITVFSLALDRAHLERPVGVDVLVAASPARAGRAEALRLRSVVHERTLPLVKHVGTFDLFHHWRQARLAGFDDALFCTAAGEVSEGPIWNIGFWDGSKVIWPAAPALPGITRQLLETGLRALGVHTETRPVFLRDLAGFRSAFIMNSASVGPLVRSIDENRFHPDAELGSLLVAAHESQPVEAI